MQLVSTSSTNLEYNASVDILLCGGNDKSFPIDHYLYKTTLLLILPFKQDV